MKYLRSLLWIWGITYLLFSGYYFGGFFAFVGCLLHHKYFDYSLKYDAVLVTILIVIALRVTMMPYLCMIQEKESYTGVVKEVKEYGAIVQVEHFKKVLVYELEADLGDKIYLEGKLNKLDSLHNRGLFDYQRYMNQRGIYQTLTPTMSKVLRKSYTPSAIAYRYIQSLPIQSIANNFLYGIDDNEPYAVFFSTGLHFSFLFYHINKLVSFYLKKREASWIEVGLPIVFLCCFPFQISLRRICIQKILKLSKLSYIERTALTYGILLFMQPSLCSSLSLVIPFLLALSNLFVKNMPRMVSSKLVLFPIMLMTQYEVSLFWLVGFDFLKNIFSISFVSSLLAILLPFYPISLFAKILYQCSISLCSVFSSLTSIAVLGKFTLGMALLYFFGLFLIQENRKGIGYIVLSIVLFLVSIYGKPWTTISFLDVGQGDCMVVEYPFRQGSVMVDTGGGKRERLAEQVLLPYLKSKGIRKLEALIISHHDEDHDGAMEELKNVIPMQHVIDYDNAPQGIRIGKNTIQFLDIVRHGEEENDKSLISLFEFGKYSLLSAGDLDVENEEQLLKEYPKLLPTFYKLSHHGSASSSSIYYLARLSPQIVFNSSGRNNFYSHPSPEVTQRLDELTIPLYDTQERGSIHLYIFPHFSFILSAQ